MLSAIAAPLIVGLRAKTKSTPSPIGTVQSAIGNGQNEPDVPIADFNPPEQQDPAKRAKRVKANKRHNLLDQNLSAETRAKFVLKEDKPVRVERPKSAPPGQIVKGNHQDNPPVIGAAINDDSPVEPALPTYNSDAVVIGTIQSASAFLSEDKTSVYSEFALQIFQVLKNPSSGFESASLTVLRPGGGVRFPSGNVKYFLIDGRGSPHVGNRYLLFLKYDNLAECYYISNWLRTSKWKGLSA